MGEKLDVTTEWVAAVQRETQPKDELAARLQFAAEYYDAEPERPQSEENVARAMWEMRWVLR